MRTKEEIALYAKEWREKNKDLLKIKNKLRYEENKEDRLLQNEKYRQENLEKVKIKRNENYLNKRDLILAKQKQDRIDNPEKYKLKDKLKSLKRAEKRKEFLLSNPQPIYRGSYNITLAERNKELLINQNIFVYHLEMKDLDGTIFYKYGLSIRVKQRLEKIPYKCKILKIIEVDKYEAIYIEDKLLSKETKYTPLKQFKGYTECFVK